MQMSWLYATPLRERRTAVIVPLFLSIMLILLSLVASSAARVSGTSAANPILLSPAGTDGQELLILDPRSGTVLNRIPNQNYGIYQAFVSPRGDRALIEYVEEREGTPSIRLELRTLPDWSLLAQFPVDYTIPPLAPLAAEAPAGANPSLFTVAFSSDGDLAAVAFFTGQDWPTLVVTTLDLAHQRWADWALTVPRSSYAWLFPLETQLLVVSRAMVPLLSGDHASIYSLDPVTGAVRAELGIRLHRSLLPQRGQDVPSTSPGVIAVHRDGQYLRILTDDLTRFSFDIRTLALVQTDPPLYDELAALKTVFTPHYTVAAVRPDEIVLIDNQRWQITQQTKLSSDIMSWELVGPDPSRPVVYIASEEDQCLRTLDLSTLALSQPLVCALFLPVDWRHFYGWPDYAPGVVQSAPVPATTSWMKNLASLATAVLAATFVLAALGKTVAWRTSSQQLGTVVPQLSRRAPLILAGLVAAETGTAVLLLLPLTSRFGLASATGLLFVFLGVSLFAVRRAPRQPCPCFGSLGPALTGRAVIVRNLFLLGIAFLAWSHPQAPTLPQMLLGLLAVLVALNVSRLAAGVAVIRTARRGTTFDHAA
uniref:Methylamine utilisation protein MauE domain-containing protein n=1 Tax=Thermomicrobium roseum TaxID=500 RepID=A0A7C2B813_THERO